MELQRSSTSRFPQRHTQRTTTLRGHFFFPEGEGLCDGLDPCGASAKDLGASDGKTTLPLEALPLKALPLKALPLKALPLKALPLKALPLKALPLEALPLKSFHPVATHIYKPLRHTR